MSEIVEKIYVASTITLDIFYSFAGQLYGLEKFWAFLKYYKHSRRLAVDPRLTALLQKFQTLEDFRAPPVSREKVKIIIMMKRSQRSH
jgi:la-related protein 1